MNELDFYLFDVDHGQCAALRLPNGHWCVFDLGASERFHPLRDWILPRLGGYPVLKTTISHLHGDHLTDLPCLDRIGTQFLRFPDIDGQYVNDAVATCSGPEGRELVEACLSFARRFAGAVIPDYGGVLIREKSLGAVGARRLGGAANTRVNNASIVTRIDYAGRSILICGDVEASAWDRLLGPEAVDEAWLAFVSGVDILVAPHHAHRSGYSSGLVSATRPAVVLASVQGRDPHVVGEYSKRIEVTGLQVNGETRRLLTTRQDGHIRVTICPATWPGDPGTIRVTTSTGAPPPTSAEERDNLVTLLRIASVTGIRDR